MSNKPIPCADCQPPERGWYLAYSTKRKRWQEMFWSGGAWGFCLFDNITHWMHLPPPPPPETLK